VASDVGAHRNKCRPSLVGAFALALLAIATGLAAAVECHEALLAAAIQHYGGVHFKTVGDAVQAAFPTSPQGVAAAVEGQRALLAEDWPGEHELTPATVPRLTTPCWARSGGSAAAAIARAPRSRTRPACP
jgi:class 3 adenylate cyclase